MLLLTLLRPRDIPQRKTQWNWRVRWYFALLKHMMPLYKRCAVSDMIQVGDVRIVHTVQDYGYEQELQRFHIDVAQHMDKMSTPISMKRPMRRSRLFHWTESMVVYANGKSYTIHRADSYTIQTDMTGQLKISSDKDIILRSEFASKAVKANEPARSSVSSSVSSGSVPNDRPKSGNKRKITIKDTVPSSQTTVHETPKSSAVPPPSTTQYRGFEENDLF